MRILFIMFVGVSGCLLACKTLTKSAASPHAALEKQLQETSNRLDQLALLLEGTFINTNQHTANPNDFHHVRMKIMRIWHDHSDAKWFYVEQALNDLLDQPYRQRVYKVFRGERDTLISQVWELPDPKALVGVSGDSEIWKEVRPRHLTLRQGCEVYIAKNANGIYAGETRDMGCESRIRGAHYVQSKVEISVNALKTWDIGLDSTGTKLWGAKEAYIFERLPPMR